MGEVVAQVVEEKVPEPPKYAPFIVQWPDDHVGGAEVFKTLEDAKSEVSACIKEGFPARILRVQPPTPAKKQRVEIDWEKIRRDEPGVHSDSDLPDEWLRDVIEANARIVDEEVQP